MIKKFNRTIGSLTFNEQHNFFHGYISGAKVTVNQVTTKDGSIKWFVKEELELYEMQEKNTNRNDHQD